MNQQPYQSAARATADQATAPIRALGTAALSLPALKAAGSGLKRILPFLNDFVPDELAEKGLAKVDPRFGKFFKASQKEGYDIGEIREFIKEKLSGAEQQNEPAKENRNVIEQYSPELFNFLKEQIGQGRDPIQAGAIAQNDSRFGQVIQKMAKDHKTQWSNILQSVFGMGQAQGQAEEQQMQPQQQQQQQQPQQDQEINPQIAQLLQQGNEILKRARMNRG